MKVKAKSTGLLRHYIGEKEKEYELPEGSNTGDLLLMIGREFGPRFPGNMWDAEEERFHHLIVAIRKGSRFAGGDEPLQDGDEVFIISRMSGG